jgi:hypothetical protein
MEALGAFQLLLAVAVSVAGWFLRSLHEDHKQLGDKFTEHQRDVMRDFVRRDDYHNDMREIKSMLDKIFNQLNKKVDKE